MSTLMNLNDAKVSNVSLAIASTTSYESWKKLGIGVSQMQESSSFWLGDWLNAGHVLYGTKYKDALTILGDRYEYQSLVNIAYVCNNVKLEQRVPELLFSHHREVCKMPPDEQSMWLNKAKENKWSAGELRRQIRSSAELRPREIAVKQHVSLTSITMQFNTFQKTTCAKSPIQEWDKDRVVSVMKDLTPIATFYVKLQQRLKELQ